MHLLYLDDSGSVGNSMDRHVILAGISVYERQTYWFSKQLDKMAAEIWPDNPQGLEFRGADMFSGKKHWRGVAKDVRMNAYRQILGIIGQSKHVTVFGAAVHKISISPDDPMEYAFEQICSRFDRFLGRLHRNNDTQRGLIILDESSYETSIQSLAQEFRAEGHRWGQLYNLSDVPFFVNSKATRLIQMADLVAYALRKYYENGDSSYIDLISPRFDAEGGVIHGLVHNVTGNQCNCLSCRQKRAY